MPGLLAGAGLTRRWRGRRLAAAGGRVMALDDEGAAQPAMPPRTSPRSHMSWPSAIRRRTSIEGFGAALARRCSVAQYSGVSEVTAIGRSAATGLAPAITPDAVTSVVAQQSSRAGPNLILFLYAGMPVRRMRLA